MNTFFVHEFRIYEDILIKFAINLISLEYNVTISQEVVEVTTIQI